MAGYKINIKNQLNFYSDVLSEQKTKKKNFYNSIEKNKIFNDKLKGSEIFVHGKLQTSD